MAVKWAVANGNWSNGTTWNGGSVPQVGDDVYLNGHTISITSSFSIGSGTISNGLNPSTQIAGGMLRLAISRLDPTIVANFSASSQMFSISEYNVLTIIGDINASGTFIMTVVSSVNLVVVGNIYQSSSVFAGKSSVGAHNAILLITGNLSLVDSYLISPAYQSTRSLTAIGNISIDRGGIFSADEFLNTFSLNGSLSNIYGRNILAINASVNGNITYATTTGGMGLYAISMTINNPDTFTWKDVTEPRSNPFIILTDAEMNNRQQYPSEDVVKQGVEYVWGEKVGTYQQPPESVVLKDFVYDNGDKTGTLETSNMSQQLISRLENCATVETVQQLLVAHLDN